jgi:RNA polymerase sigma-70 factor (ECF subfamily)
LPADDDMALVAAYIGGDTAAFDALFARYHDRVRATCRKYFGSAPAAEDLVQETFFNVVRALPKVERPFNLSAWIQRIASNLCVDELRRRSRARNHGDAGNDDDDDTILQLADRDRHSQPEAALEITELRRVVWEVAKRLPERQRMVLTLRELQGLPYSSIASVMGISESAVETLLHRARKRFRQEYLELDTAAFDCGNTAHLLSQVPRDEWSSDQRRGVLRHLAACDSCRGAHADQMRELQAAG